MELYDQPLVEALQRMKNAGVFDNTVLLILGDHGQRIVSSSLILYYNNQKCLAQNKIHTLRESRRKNAIGSTLPT